MSSTLNPLQPSGAQSQNQQVPLTNSQQQPPHQFDGSSIQKHLLHQKFFEARTSFASPTDNLMSPCTAKLQAHKKKHYVKSKPQLLRFGNMNVTTANKENATSDQSGLGF
ncbi:hypothetical protein V1512DRAFT_264462 [Lipomyces arxii]|uniref:uncharacterized protein n=1 Tax=Lipomyces arxii TaxID=56418 RepID=UPI0034CF0A1D